MGIGGPLDIGGPFGLGGICDAVADGGPACIGPGGPIPIGGRTGPPAADGGPML